ncbi:MAG: PEGA domain-containing protein [Deltaproteobacteria bacterium]|nr:PEGA domain-containing protein [Deltaproteobacteria bacterium]MCB9787156.1 PEGA domain-containing protein [Deltaproteobacteria bacterium]
MQSPRLGRSRALLVAAACAVCLGVLGPAARAQDDRAQAGILVEEGLEMARAGRFAEAATRFDQAFKLYPHPEILHNLARAHEELGQRVTALGEFRRALEMDPEYTFAADARKRVVALQAKLRETHGLVRVTSTPSAQVQLRFTVDGEPLETHAVAPAELWVPAGRLRVSGTRPGFVDGDAEVDVTAGAELTVELVLPPMARKGFIAVVAPVEGAAVTIDGSPAGSTPLSAVPIEEGEHVVRVESAGRHPFEERVLVVADRETAVRALMEPLEPPAPPAMVGGPRPTLGVAFIGGGVGVAILGAVMHGLAFSNANDAGAVVNDPTTTSDDERFQTLETRAEREQTVAFISYGVGAAAVGVGIYFLMRKPHARSEGEVATPRLAPVIAPTRGGVGLGARLSF